MGQKNKKTIEIRESNHTSDTIRTSETSTEYKDKLLSKYNLQHCRTKCLVRKTNFQWNIENFWNICNFIDTLRSSDIEGESCKIDMSINRENNKLYFFLRSTDPTKYKEQINIYRYNVYIQGIEGAVLYADWKRFYFNADPLYEVCLEILLLNKIIYVPNDTLSVHFTFESYEHIAHINMYENILDEKEFTAMNDLVSDKSNSIVTFLVEGKHLRVNKSLVCAASPVFEKMLKEHNEDVEGQAKVEIEISDAKYDIFKIIIFYINAGDVFELKFDANNDIMSQISTLIYLLATSHVYCVYNLKLICEKRLIAYVTKANVVWFLDIAITYNAVYLENYVKKFIKLHFDDIKYNEEFLKKTRINPEILSSIYELELFTEYASYIKYNGA